MTDPGFTRMRLASFRAKDRTSYGVVVANGIIDLGRRLPLYPTMLDFIQGNGVGAARDAAGSPDYALDDVVFLPPVPDAKKILCVGINYPERAEEYRDKKERPKYPNLFVRFPGSLVGHREPLIRPQVSEQF